MVCFLAREGRETTMRHLTLWAAPVERVMEEVIHRTEDQEEDVRVEDLDARAKEKRLGKFLTLIKLKKKKNKRAEKYPPFLLGPENREANEATFGNNVLTTYKVRQALAEKSGGLRTFFSQFHLSNSTRSSPSCQRICSSNFARPPTFIFSSSLC